ncbi:hypothetical protein T440DRAFT_247752 [Plenodomus tracheiphilus IPT5]|uniref:Uncharacterized protein n=1 Tax=Plenodomus tracheiphilus IPT5 TaxID=1408161 RepID=A0A6A7AS07_9PLEO|nr:hypothetical protein T440DRAFT_247752 [Plenodomus tracheiphilus IPT5]
MRFCILASTGLDIDVDADLSKVKGGLSPQLLTKLGPTQALDLFNRVRKVRGDYAFLEGSSNDSILHLGIAYHVAIRDTQIWHLHLLKLNGDHDTALRLAKEYVESKKRSANTASQPEQRGHYAKAALFATIASGSLDSYKYILKWAERFMNDPLVFREIYPQAFPSEAVRLLSGVPEPIDGSLTTLKLRDSVEKANSILAGMFDTACAAMMQPSFSPSAWNGVFYLFQAAIGERIKLTAALAKALTITSQELYDTLWEGTVKMLVSIEEMANSEECKKLGENKLQGLLYCHSWEGTGFKIDATNPLAMKFFDSLAKKRDALWCKLRAAAYPNLSSMPDCLPRGLAIQHLISNWSFEVENLDALAPYLASRVKSTLFPDPQVAFQIVPTDKKSQECVGVFVDSFECALELYVPKCCTKAMQQTRVQEVWDYATSTLSHNRLKDKDITRYWKRQAPHALREWPPKEFRDASVFSALPEPNVTSAVISWNPLEPEGIISTAPEPEAPTYMDVSVGISSRTFAYPTIEDTVSLKDLAYKPHTFDHENQDIWDECGKMNEIEVLSALLYLDENSSEESLLQSPYPSDADIRYPAVRLDEAFLTRKGLSPHSAVRSIRGHLNNTPPELIHRLAVRVMRALNAADSNSLNTSILHEVIMLLIVRLGESDRPSFAIELAVDTIINRPNSSSWHRNLLKFSFLRRLSAVDAAKCYQELTSRISQVVQDDMTAKAAHEGKGSHPREIAGEDETSSSRKGPYVKVTTLKLLIQLITGTSIVDEDTAINTLRNLATIATHVDVRLNIVKALLDMLVRYEATHTEAIITTLDSVIAPASNLNERDPIIESDWQKAEAALEPPNIHTIINEPISTSSPMLNALLQHIWNDEVTAKHLTHYLNHIILPILTKLKQQTTRWVTIFLRKNGIDKPAQQALNLPLVPWQTDFILLRTLVKINDGNKLRALPSSLLESLIAYAIYSIAPPPALIALHKKLRDDPAIYTQPDTQTYLLFYGRGLETARAIIPGGLFGLLGKICTVEESEASLPVSIPTSTSDPSDNDAGITPQLIHTLLLSLFETLVRNDDPTSSSLTTLLHPILNGTYLASPWWPTHGVPILREMISYIEALRTETWKRDPSRKPIVLPDTFAWRLMLLDFPIPRTDDGERDRQIGLVVKETVRESGGVYHGKLEALKGYVGIEPSTPGVDVNDHAKREVLRQTLHFHRGLAAVYLGNIQGEGGNSGQDDGMGGLEIILRVEIAAHLLSIAGKVDYKGRVSGMDKRVQEKARSMARVWKESDNEEGMVSKGS